MRQDSIIGDGSIRFLDWRELDTVPIKLIFIMHSLSISSLIYYNVAFPAFDGWYASGSTLLGIVVTLISSNFQTEHFSRLLIRNNSCYHPVSLHLP